MVSTDSHVVTPLFFPGGDIGSLSVHGTINDVAMSGARPLYLSAGFILEEGFPLADLERIVVSMAEASRAAYARAVRAAGGGAITTEIVAAPAFYYAEDYHQQYLAKNPGGYCGLGGTGVSCPA